MEQKTENGGNNEWSKKETDIQKMEGDDGKNIGIEIKIKGKIKLGGK